MKKRVLAAVLAAILALSLAPAFADDASTATLAAGEPLTFSAASTAALEYSAEEWASTDGNRGLLTLALWLDLCSSLEADSPYYPRIWAASYVALGEDEDGHYLVVLLPAENDMLFVYYYPDGLREYAFATAMDMTDAAVLRLVLESLYPGSWWENDMDTLLTLLTAITGTD